MLTLIRAPHNYIQGENALNEFYENVKAMGKNFLIVCSRSGLKASQAKIEASCAGQEISLTFEVFGGISSKSEIARMREIIREKKIDVVVGVGGGSAIDTAKASAYYEGKKIVIVPTVCATDAPCTGLSVIYNDDGSVDSYLFYPTNPDVVIVDSSIICKSPVRFLISGMGDALGTYFEARMCQKAKAPSLENGGVSRSALALCSLCYDTLLEHGVKAKAAVELGLLTPDVDAIIEANTYLSGVGADNGGLAAAHSIYNGFTALEELTSMHGEVVAFGTLVQLILEEGSTDEFYEVMDFCHSVGLPVTLAEMGVSADPERIQIAAEKACLPGESIHNMIGDVTPSQLVNAILVTDALGKEFTE
ncbi:glycerol dehydrogenase [bacterium 210820-DFI.6.37]|nr:glycerol dehydrogenase [bacterium 210820-DFI.6.37]